MMKKYSACVTYTPDKIRKAERIIQKTFYKKNIAFRWALSLCLILYGAARQTPTGIVLLAIGCIIIGTGNYTGKQRAKRTIEALGEKPLKVYYEFQDKDILCRGMTVEHLPYDKVIRLDIEADEYCIFMGKDKVYMVDKESIPAQERDDFKQYVSSRVGLEWTKAVSLLTFSIRSLRFNRKNTRTGG